MHTIRWEFYPLVATLPVAHAWLTMQADLGRAPATITAYGSALQDYLAFTSRHGVEPVTVTRAHLAAYVRDLSVRPNQRAAVPSAPLANATLQQRLTAVRLFYDYLVEEGLRQTSPVARGRAGARAERGLLPRYVTLPWVPSDAQWQTFVAAARSEPIRNRTMLAFAYDAALRRAELCTLETGDIDPAQRLLRVRAEVAKNHRERVVPYSAATSVLYGAYLQQRRTLSHDRGPLFLSESRRNRAQPISIWTWSKVVAQLAARAGVPQFSTHTLRHLCLTDLARAGWELHEIAQFAGHRSTDTTLRYIHLSGRDLAAKVALGMAELHARRLHLLTEVLP